jgi:PAS domain S-box-containing protein
MLENGSECRIRGDARKADFSAEARRRSACLESHPVQDAIFTSAKFAVMVADERGIIQSFNVGAERMLGYSSFEVVNKIRLVDLHDPHELMGRTRALNVEFSTTIAPGFETLIYKAARGIEDGYELSYLRKDGTRLPTSVSISAVRDDHGMNVGYLSIGVDDSMRKQLELKLNQAVQDAENADLAKASCLSDLCHELRTPLNAILGFAQLMASRLPPPTRSQQRNIDLILEAGWCQQKLINEILDLALIESGQMALSLEPVSLADLMVECQVMTESQAQTRGVSLSFPTIESTHYVNADRVRMRQVIISLLSYAIDFSKSGGTVVVDCDTRIPERIRFCIHDGGGGLPADPFAPLIEPLNHAGNDATAEQRMGVGIVLTKRLVALMGGTIGVGDKIGADRVLWFELKRMVHPPNAGSPSTNPSSEQEDYPDAGPMRKILYVMDNAADSPLVEDLIACRPDIHLMSAWDDSRGVEIARDILPDVILMDINLTATGGVTALKSLAEDPVTAHIPVVALSANLMTRDIESEMNRGFFRNIIKPINADEFMDTLDVAFEYAAAPPSRAINEHIP